METPPASQSPDFYARGGEGQPRLPPCWGGGLFLFSYWRIPPHAPPTTSLSGSPPSPALLELKNSAEFKTLHVWLIGTNATRDFHSFPRGKPAFKKPLPCRSLKKSTAWKVITHLFSSKALQGFSGPRCQFLREKRRMLVFSSSSK